MIYGTPLQLHDDLIHLDQQLMARREKMPESGGQRHEKWNWTRESASDMSAQTSQEIRRRKDLIRLCCRRRSTYYAHRVRTKSSCYFFLSTPTQAVSACTSNGTYRALEREPSDLTSKPTQSLDHTLNH
jgi:hypothetical protein